MTVRAAILRSAFFVALTVPLAVPLAAASRPIAEPPPRNPKSSVASPGAVQRLLDERRWSEAVQACEGIAAEPGRRDLAQFLFQYGTALSHAGRPESAALMFMRQALLFPGAPQTAESLFETASILHGPLGDAAAAERLRQEAMAVARGQGNQALLRRGEALRREWDRDVAHDPPVRR
ncbi:MAG: hypothetical protein KDA22_02775 [Phycisphaerales bacterium]|nr:hypothetical protein [Phycisphaerales bacterium]